MKKEIKNDGTIEGYQIGKSILIHEHVYDPKSWFITIRPLKIFGENLCKKDCTEAEIARYINVILLEKLNIINELITDVVPFI